MAEDFNSENFNHGKMVDINISSEMRDNFLSYSMSVIIDRALPDVKDGLKPVHRRVLWTMYSMGNTPDKPHIKSANIVGEVLGKYHPHGDTAAYDTMVRMAQDFSYRYPLVDGHGNFGSIDGDEAAAYRYTEARMSKISLQLLEDIKKETIDWKDNYDARFKEPVVLPSRFPNLLVNGSMGIAVGMATNMPPHNLTEAINAIELVMDNPDCDTNQIMEVLTGPDFPTGGYIVGRSGIRQAYETGKGSIIVRSKVETSELPNGKHRLTVKEIPYMVNKAVLVDKIAQLHREKLVDGITDLKDLSNDRNGIRIEIDLRKDVQPEVLLNQLYKLTPLQSSFGINNNVLVENQPMLLPIKQIIKYYIEHQIDVIKRRTQYDLNKSEERAHILEGLKIALDNIDEIINIIKSSKDDEEAINKFNERFGIDEIQSKAILDMQLRRLTSLQKEKIFDELNELYKLIQDYKDILASHTRIISIIKDELNVIKDKFGDERKTEIIDGGADYEDEDLIPSNDVIITLSTNGYVKRLLVDTYKVQNRGGKGIKGMTLNDNDIVDQAITMNTHEYLLVFTNKGKVYRIKGYKIPEASRNSKGIPFVNIINIEKDEKVKALVPIPKEAEIEGYLFFVTKNGLCKKVRAEEFESIRNSGKIAISLKEDDELVNVMMTFDNDDIIIGASNGKAVRFNESTVRPTGRSAAGVKAMNVDGSYIIGSATSKQGKYILTVSKYGYGKMSNLDDFRVTSRGCKGVKAVKISEKNGELIALKAVNGDEDLLLMSNDGITIRIDLSKVSVLSRNTVGVTLMKQKSNDAYVSSATILPHQEEETSEEGNE